MKLLIVDDHPLVRKGIASTLSFDENIREILESSNIKDAMEIIKKENIALAIIDLNLGNQDGLEIVSISKNLGYTTKFIVLTSSIRREDYIRAKEINVDGYILKEAFAEDILYAIHLVLRGKKYIDPEVIRYESQRTPLEKQLNELTPRERDILIELGEGLSNNEIARKLFISENTVKKHVSNILFKLELNHRTQAALLINKSASICG